MMIKYLLKRYKVDDFYFVNYYENGVNIYSLAVKINELDAYDVINKKKILNLGYNYEKELSDYVAINDKVISLHLAKKLAKPLLKKFMFYCEEQEDLKHPMKNKLKEHVEHKESTKGDIFM